MTKALSARVLLASSGLIVGFLILEAALRLLGVSYPRISERDENRGYRYRSGVGWHQRDEGEAWISINSAGFRDRERSETKTPGTVRIAVLGDSFVDAWQLPLDSIWTSLLEKRLNECATFAPDSVEVLNFGVSGYGTAQELMTLRHHVWEYSPDIVLLAFLTGNDVRDNTAALHRDPKKPYFLFQNARLVLDTSFRRRPGLLERLLRSMGFSVLDKSRLAQVVYRVRKKALEKENLREVFETDALGDVPGQELGLSNMVYLPPNHPAWEEGWRITEALISLMREEVVEHGATFIVVTLCNSIQVHPDRRVRQDFIDRLGIQDLFYPDDRIGTLGAAKGFRVIGLARPLQAYAESTHVFLHGFGNTTLGQGHWNVDGHREAARLMARELSAIFGRPPCPG